MAAKRSITIPSEMNTELRDIARRRGAAEGILLGGIAVVVVAGAVLLAVAVTGGF